MSVTKLLKYLTTTLVLFFAFNLLTAKVHAVEDPLASPNNPFGIHIIHEGDLEDAAALVNSNGGNWGYVTLVIREDEKDHKRWQAVFDKMRRLRLIPIVRIASTQTPEGWNKLDTVNIDSWAVFLGNLNWVIKNRYIIVGNEPNHAKEWGGEVNPEEYAEYLAAFSKSLKKESGDFFILPAGFDASAPTDSMHMSQDEYMRAMVNHVPNVFEHIDGWTSHSYPNPDFSGLPSDGGRGSVRTFEWELEFLESLGVTRDLPVFITETGWAHDMEGTGNGFKDIATISDKLKYAYQTAWKDERIITITPFILNYQDPPFDVFSWKRPDGSFYDFYYEIQKLPKPAGNPEIITAVDVLSVILPPIIPTKEGFFGIVMLKNKGQDIWTGQEKIFTSYLGFELILEPKVLLLQVEPQGKTLAFATLSSKR